MYQFLASYVASPLYSHSKRACVQTGFYSTLIDSGNHVHTQQILKPKLVVLTMSIATRTRLLQSNP